MAFSKSAVFVTLLLLVIAEVSIEAAQKDKVFNERRLIDGTASKVDCPSACKVRCMKHGRPNVCLRACGTCCLRCNCVPSGQSGNREECGTCYTDMKTHNNRTKCP